MEDLECRIKVIAEGSVLPVPRVPRIVPGVMPRVRVEIRRFQQRFRPQVRLIDRDYRIGVRILADGSGFYAL